MRGPVRTDEGAQDLSSLCSLPCGNSGRRRPAAVSVTFLGALPRQDHSPALADHAPVQLQSRRTLAETQHEAAATAWGESAKQNGQPREA
jgi:hypothetical protein